MLKVSEEEIGEIATRHSYSAGSCGNVQEAIESALRLQRERIVTGLREKAADTAEDDNGRGVRAALNEFADRLEREGGE